MEIFGTFVPNLTSILFILFTGILFIFLTSNSSPTSSLLIPKVPSLACSRRSQPPVDSVVAHQVPPPDELDVALRKASTKNRTVIIAVVNQAYVDPANSEAMDQTMLDLFLQSFWLGEGTRTLIDHLLVVAMDRAAYLMCKFRRLNCYKLATEGVDFSGEKIYMSEDFIKMMWSRTAFLADVLRRGYSFIFTDTDVMWLRNPFLRLSSNETEDFQISTDEFNGDPWSDKNYINTGFYFVRANNRTVSMFETWYSMKDSTPGLKEQDVLLNLTQSGLLRDQMGLNIRYLDTVYFSGFCNNSKDFGLVTTVHANCCRSIVAKVLDLATVLRDWKRYRFSYRKAGHARNRISQGPPRWSDHIGCWKSWRITQH